MIPPPAIFIGIRREESPSKVKVTVQFSTLDAAAPTANSNVYSGPIAHAIGRHGASRLLMPDGQMGLMASKSFAGAAPVGWKVVAVDGEETTAEDDGAAMAIDGKSASIWHTRPGTATWHCRTPSPLTWKRLGTSADLPIFPARTVRQTAS